MSVFSRAFENLLVLTRNPYPGRGIILGRAPDNSLVQIYWVMGRSEGSRNRILTPIDGQHGWLETCLADPGKFTGDQSELELIIYPAMAEERGIYIVSNGKQTDAVMRKGIHVLDRRDWQYEPDAPNFTPRITGEFDIRSGMVAHLVILRKSLFGSGCDIAKYIYRDIAAGYGYFISTYLTDGKPLPSYRDDPQLMPIYSSDPMEIAEMYWASLNPENRVAIAVKNILSDGTSQIAIINRHQVAA